MVRVTDGRVGGTVSGTAVLQITPEAAIGGPIGLVETGDTIVLDFDKRRLDVELSDEELEARRQRKAAEPLPTACPRVRPPLRRQRDPSGYRLRLRLPARGGPNRSLTTEATR